MATTTEATGAWQVSDFLEMEGAPKPHDQMRQDNLLHTWQDGMFIKPNNSREVHLHPGVQHSK